jgi:hypothetical protein
MILSLRRKILVGLFAIDALLSLILSSLGIGSLSAWFILNLIVVIPALVIYIKFSNKTTRIRQKSIGYYQESGQASKRNQQYDSRQTTLSGETVKSFGEKTLADYFFKSSIRYQYEHPAWAKGGRRISRPDFYLPDYDVYVEYWGMTDTKDAVKREEYLASMKWKMDKYHQNGIKFISIYRENLSNLDWIFKAKLREETGIELNKT